MGWIAGVDGCKAGWIAAFCDLSGVQPPLFRVFPNWSALLAGTPAPELIAVDMPIGLPDRIVGSGRGPEQAVRALLGERQSSVFSIPSRSAVHAEDYAGACGLALATSAPPRKVSKQGFHLFPRIREIDALLRAEPGWRERIFETHPELAFRTMRGAPLVHPKKIRGAVNPAGMAERRSLLLAAGLPAEIVHARPPRGPPPTTRSMRSRPWSSPGTLPPGAASPSPIRRDAIATVYRSRSGPMIAPSPRIQP